jgi:prophage tail gpP-like protein
MSKATPGKQYTIKAGDTLSSIASSAYGDPALFTRIQKANQSTIISDEITTGEILNIPVLPEDEIFKTSLAKLKLSNKSKNDLTILVDDLEIPILSARIIRTIDNAADAWSSVLSWNPGENKELDKRLRPYAYPKASVYIGGELVINGVLYTVESNLSARGRTKTLAGWSFTADAIDSTLQPPYEKNNVTLKQRADELVESLGIRAVFNDDVGGKFDRVTAAATDTVFSHLAKLATQRGFLITSSPNGDLLFTKASNDEPVGTLTEDSPMVQSWAGKFDGRARFNAYRAIGQSPGDNAKVAIAKDDAVPRSRFMTFTAKDTIAGDIQSAADWRRSKQIVDALTISLPVSSWFSPNGSLWKENTLVTVISETLHIPDGFTLLIRSVEYIFAKTGQTAILSLIPKEAYTGEAIVEPWIA